MNLKEQISDASKKKPEEKENKPLDTFNLINNAAKDFVEKNREKWRNAPGAKKNMVRKGSKSDNGYDGSKFGGSDKFAELPASLRRKFEDKSGELPKSKKAYANRSVDFAKEFKFNDYEAGDLYGESVPNVGTYKYPVVIFFLRKYPNKKSEGNDELGFEATTSEHGRYKLSKEAASFLRSEDAETYGKRVEEAVTDVYEMVNGGSIDLMKYSGGSIVSRRDIRTGAVNGDYMFRNTDFIFDHMVKYTNGIAFCFLSNIKSDTLRNLECKKAIQRTINKGMAKSGSYFPDDFVFAVATKDPSSYGSWSHPDYPDIQAHATSRAKATSGKDDESYKRNREFLKKEGERDLKKQAIEAMKSGDTSWTYTHRYGFGWKGAESKEVSPEYAYKRYTNGDFPELSVDPEKRIIHVNEYSLGDMD